MAYSTISKSSSFMNTKLYSGNSSANAQTGVGFEPSMTWFKVRNHTYDNLIIDAVRGSKRIRPNLDSTESDYTAFTSFDTDGFTLGNGAMFNESGKNYVSWNWKAGTTSGITTDGNTTITPTAYSFNQTSGISIIKYVGNGTTGAKVAHGLGVAPKMVMFKSLDTTDWWNVHHTSLGSNSELYLNGQDAAPGSTGNGTTPDAVNLELEGTGNAHNGNGNNYIAYCFAEKLGYSKIGSYTHNGQSGNNGNFIYTGMKVKFLMLKNASAGSTDWLIQDTTRSTGNEVDDCLFANANSAESVNYNIRFLSNGFKLSGSGPTMGGSGNTVIFIAFGQTLNSSNNVPCTAF